jgi:hypothetical protein
MVTFNGAVKYDGYSNPTDSLIGIEVKDPSGHTAVVRTIQNGSSTPTGLVASISSAYLSNAAGNPLTSIPIPDQTNQVIPYYSVNVVSLKVKNDIIIRNMLVTLSVFDSNGLVISEHSQSLSISDGSFGSFTEPIQIPSWAHYGTANAYVSVFSNWPSNQGYPIAMEKAFQFTITGGTPFSGTPTKSYMYNGFYNFTFRLPRSLPMGTYTAYASSNYTGAFASATKTFQVLQLGDIYPVPNGDGEVNFRDLTLFVSYYVAYYSPSSTYYAAADFNHDGQITFRDITAFVSYYIAFWGT